MSRGNTVNIATLKRGVDYKIFWEGQYETFKRSVPRKVSDGLADELEGLVDTLGTDDNQVLEVEKFDIERNVPASRVTEVDENEVKVRTRTRLVREEVPIKPKGVKKRKIPIGSDRKASGFGSRRSAE